MRITSWYADTTRSRTATAVCKASSARDSASTASLTPPPPDKARAPLGVGLVPGVDRAFHGALQGRAEPAATRRAGRRRGGGFRRSAGAVGGRDLRGVDRAERERRRHRSVSMMRVSMPRVTSSTETLAL